VTERPFILTIREARRLASRGCRSLIVEKSAGAVKPVAPKVSPTDKRVLTPDARSSQGGCEVREPQLKAKVFPDSERIIRNIPLAALLMQAGLSFDERNVQILAASFRHAGQTSAILVVREESGVFRVLSGKDRVRAAREVGWDSIDAVVLDRNERVQRIVEIAENLHRRRISVLERANLVNDWILLVRDEAAQVAHPKGGRQPQDYGFSKAERTLGVSRAEAARSAQIASISQEAAAKAVEFNLQDNQAALLEAAKLPTPNLQVARLQEISEGKRVRRSKASPLRAGMARWDEATAGAALTSSDQPFAPNEEISIPEFLDRRNAEKEFARLNQRWSEFRLLLENAPLAARRRFVQNVLMHDPLVKKDAAPAFHPKRATTSENGSAT
jgi:hypothetical protein